MVVYRYVSALCKEYCGRGTVVICKSMHQVVRRVVLQTVVWLWSILLGHLRSSRMYGELDDHVTRFVGVFRPLS